ncbi:MAG TPA: helicase associated domain-containing protein [Arthrobacter sp.]|uniref:helicase associated domain-containing protein n=1 Tax=Arthrobacter sp. TaxID=1667 RepID=UPI002F424213
MARGIYDESSTKIVCDPVPQHKPAPPPPRHRARLEEARDGTLATAYRDGLAALSGWQTSTRAQADSAWWEERLSALVTYRAAGNDWPRHKSFVEGLEHELGVWLHYQRAKLHRGELDQAKFLALDQALPGWREGRRRGRKSRKSPERLT